MVDLCDHNPWVGDTQPVAGMVIGFKLFVIIEDREIGSQEIEM